MELHHKLRRDPNWHPNGCNICGQLGHQASTCPNGTVDWKARYGDAAFQLRINQDPQHFRSPTDAEWSGKVKDLYEKSSEYTKLRETAMKDIQWDDISQKLAGMYEDVQKHVAAAQVPVQGAPAAQP